MRYAVTQQTDFRPGNHYHGQHYFDTGECFICIRGERKMDVIKLVKEAEEKGFTKTDFDDDVLNEKADEAHELNASGLKEQFDFLLSRKNWDVDLIRDVMRRREPFAPPEKV